MKDKMISQIMLNHTKLNLIDATRLALEMLEKSPEAPFHSKKEAMRYCREVIRMGSEAYRLSIQTVSLKEAIYSLLEQKSDMRERTRSEIRQICMRFAQSSPDFEAVKVRAISAETCQQALENAFATIPSRQKARRILHSLFSHAIKKGWCASNPMVNISLPQHRERPIHALKIDEVLSLLKTAESPEHVLCAPALGIMLWAGIRPHEIERLRVKHIDFEDKVITVPAAHAKTGGARQVTMHPVLTHWLRKTMSYQLLDTLIVPSSWTGRWAQLRKAAGFSVWSPDVLRHTFASYHLKFFKDMRALQLEMGHSTPELLRTRYLAMENVTAKAANIYWNYGLPRRSK